MKFASVLPTWTLKDASETRRETRLPRGRNLSWGEGEVVSPPPGSVRPRPFHEPPSLAIRSSPQSPADPPRTPPAPQRSPPGARQPANHTPEPLQSRFQRDDKDGPTHGSEAGPPRAPREHPPLRPPPPGPGMAASSSPGPSRSPCSGGDRGDAAGDRLLAVGEEEIKLPPDGPSRGNEGGRAGSPGGRAGPGAAAATAVPSAPLFPFQEDPGVAEPGNQEVPRRDTSCRRYGNGPRLQGG